MSQAPQHDDPAPHHEGPIRTPKQLVVAVLLAFIVPVVTIILLAEYVTSASKPAAGSDGMAPKAVEQRIAPVASVAVKDASDAAALKSGAEVYKAQCAVCHEAGVAQAPKLGDAAAWEPRIKTGYEALLASALKGKGNMLAQGGGDHGELEIGRAVVHMANASGAKFDEPKAAAPTAAAEPSAPAPVAAAPAAAPAPPVQPAAAKPAAQPAAAAPVAAAAIPPLYTQACGACHDQGIANAPKPGDKAAWGPRLAAGVEGLTQSVIAGKGVMPPKGGAATASEAEIKAAVGYLADSVK